MSGIRTYDLNGTRISGINTLRGITGRNFNYSDEDHLLTVGDKTYEYDLDGFLTRKTDGTEVTAYAYSTRGELLRADLAGGRWVSYDHDPLGRRIAKRIDGNIVEKYLWQGLTRLLAVYDNSDNLAQRFEYADGRLPVAMTQAGSIYYLAYDQVGSLRVVTDASGNVIKRIDYDSFGNVLTDTNTALTVPFGFAGGLADRDTGLVRFGYRDYDPDTGRWSAKDPIGFAGGDTDLYGYVQSNPVNLVDPWGLMAFKWHGNWGGPGYAAGRMVAEANLTLQDFLVPAVDPRDQCYKGHDQCIWEASQNCSDKKVLSDRIEQCDYILADNLEKISPFEKSFWFRNINGGRPEGLLPSTVEANLVFKGVAPIIH